MLEVHPKDFIDQELSWLSFNERVLFESLNHNHCLLERLKFLAISGHNLDEFFMVKISRLKRQLQQKGPLAAKKQTETRYQAILKKMHELLKAQQSGFLRLKKALRAENIHILKLKNLSATNLKWVEDYFQSKVLPLLTPITIDTTHPFPFIANKSLNILTTLEFHHEDGLKRVVITLPQAVDRFVHLPKDGFHFIFLEEMIVHCLPLLFPNATIHESCLFRFVRAIDYQADDWQDESLESLADTFEHAIKLKHLGAGVMLQVQKNNLPANKTFLLHHLDLMPEDLFEVDHLVGITSLDQLSQLDLPHLKFKPFTAKTPRLLNAHHGDFFSLLKEQPLLIHHPYDSFDVVVKFLEHAALDPQVLLIKQTLYRTGADSPIIKALIKAAESGKSVTVLVELKARFDEEMNLHWARTLEKAGIQVVYGVSGLKTHAKVSLVVRKEGKKLVHYTHFGTGNYHKQTAKLYTDLSYFSCDKALGEDASSFFHLMTGYTLPQNFNKLVIAPFHLRSTLLTHIQNEIDHVKAGCKGRIWAKMNALVDEEIIQALYHASQMGVQIDLVVRGICCLKPGRPNLSENIRVKSIIGRFLEHARIICFGNGEDLPSAKAKVFISSADWMPRNFDQRLETLIPIEDMEIKETILTHIMQANMQDESNSWHLKPSGKYIKNPALNGFDVHHYFLKTTGGMTTSSKLKEHK